MRLVLSWLREFVDVKASAEEIAATGKIIGEIVDRVTKRKSAHAIA